MRTVPGTKDTVAAMQRLYNLMREERGGFFNSRFDDIGLDLHTITRTIAQMPSSYYNDLWACPGMCQFLLTHQLGCRPNGAVQTYVNRKLSDVQGSNSRDTRLDSDDDDDEIGELGKVHEFSYLLFYLLVRTSCVQEMTLCEPSTVNVKFRKDCYAAIPATKRGLEMWLGQENCGDCMGGGAGWAKFLVEHHFNEFFQDLAIEKVAMRCIIEICESNCHNSLELLQGLLERRALRELQKLDVVRLRFAAQYMLEYSDEGVAVANRLLQTLQSLKTAKCSDLPTNYTKASSSNFSSPVFAPKSINSAAAAAGSSSPASLPIFACLSIGEPMSNPSVSGTVPSFGASSARVDFSSTCTGQFGSFGLAAPFSASGNGAPKPVINNAVEGGSGCFETGVGGTCGGTYGEFRNSKSTFTFNGSLKSPKATISAAANASSFGSPTSIRTIGFRIKRQRRPLRFGAGQSARSRERHIQIQIPSLVPGNRMSVSPKKDRESREEKFPMRALFLSPEEMKLKLETQANFDSENAKVPFSSHKFLNNNKYMIRRVLKFPSLRINS